MTAPPPPPPHCEDAEEIQALQRVAQAFRSYAVEGRVEVGRWRRQFNALPEAHQRRLANLPMKWPRAAVALETNQFFLNTMLTSLKDDLEGNGLTTEASPEDAVPRSSPSDVEKVRYVLKNLVRDWSQEGGEERAATYTPIIDELKSRLPPRSEAEDTAPRVLIPGCGLGRLVAEVASNGFDAEGNEFSYFMLLPSSFMLNHSVGVEAWTIHPWVLSTCNQISDDDQLRAVPLPDVEASALMRGSRGSMSVVAGDFVEVYSREEYEAAFDCVVTSFFVDTAHNVIEYLDVIYAVLKPGGFWINLGPLLYHWADSADQSDLSIEISLEDIQSIAEEMGFTTLSKEFISAPYLGDVSDSLSSCLLDHAKALTVRSSVDGDCVMSWDCCLSHEARKLKAFAQTTPFTFNEILRLSTKFRELDLDGNGRLSFAEVSRLPEIRANPFGRRLCGLFSEDGSESLSFRQFVSLTGIFCERTPPEIKLVWAFAMWDFDGDDLIGTDDIKTGLRLISSLPSKAIPADTSPKAKHETKLTKNELNKVLDRVFAEVDPMDEGLSFTDFKSVVSRMPDFFANFRLTI